MKHALLLLLTLLLCACGGSDGNSANNAGNNNAPPPSPNPSTPGSSAGQATPIIENADIAIYGTSSALVGESIGFAVLSKAQAFEISWEQTSGPALSFLANTSKAIGFDVPAPGDYSLELVLRFDNGGQQRHTLDFSASSAADVSANIRLDHAVTELGKASFHIQLPQDKTPTAIRWTQLSGPQILSPSQQDAFLFIDIPAVSQDTLIEYRADIDFDDGTTASDRVLLAVSNTEFDTSGLFYANNFIISQDMHAYRASSPFKDAIESCVYNNLIPSRPTCNFERLPLIGMMTDTPSVEDVLNRTLISHQWMGDSFKEYLERSEAGLDMLSLLRGVTAIVISYDVRPSFYWSATGAIYLDANNFWQTPAQRDTLNDQADFRRDFGNDLNFSVFWRYTKNNEYYPQGNYPKNERIQRRFEDVEASISWLMYHELAHANDFFPPSRWQQISRTTTPLAYFQANGANSDVLQRQYPLRSSELHALAQVSFAGQTPTASQRNYTGTDIEGFFSPDRASSYYSYLTEREDFATLAERFLMLYRLGAEADLAIIEGEQGNDFNVVWGQRNRISDPDLADRAAFAVARVYPELGNIPALIDALPSPILMDPNKGWFENLTLSAAQETQDAINEGQKRRAMDAAQMQAQALKDQQQAHTIKLRVPEP
ncbi:hypothetical protein ACFO4O_03920 [Glaciecola siphonariae]|uniref:Lipoprotein n=1 Tax=Glaciecola siphonariae TaxID=521012 RepID=A0ABV9LTX5_9ALTE